MDANEFQEFACEKWFGAKDETDREYFTVPTLGLCGEAGEVAEKMKKFFRGDGALDRYAVATEISDVIFYAAVLADRLGFRFDEIMELQVRKINGRIDRGTRRGEGDDR